MEPKNEKRPQDAHEKAPRGPSTPIAKRYGRLSEDLPCNFREFLSRPVGPAHGGR